MKLNANQKVYFKDEKLPYTVIYVSEQFVICTRPFSKTHDKDHLIKDVDMGGYCTIEEAYNDYKDYPVYTILDLKNNIRGGDNKYTAHDYNNVGECREAVLELELGELEISHRSRTKLKFDWLKTINKDKTWKKTPIKKPLTPGIYLVRAFVEETQEEAFLRYDVTEKDFGFLPYHHATHYKKIKS